MGELGGFRTRKRFGTRNHPSYAPEEMQGLCQSLISRCEIGLNDANPWCFAVYVFTVFPASFPFRARTDEVPCFDTPGCRILLRLFNLSQEVKGSDLPTFRGCAPRLRLLPF